MPNNTNKWAGLLKVALDGRLVALGNLYFYITSSGDIKNIIQIKFYLIQYQRIMFTSTVYKQTLPAEP